MCHCKDFVPHSMFLFVFNVLINCPRQKACILQIHIELKFVFTQCYLFFSYFEIEEIDFIFSHIKMFCVQFGFFFPTQILCLKVNQKNFMKLIKKHWFYKKMEFLFQISIVLSYYICQCNTDKLCISPLQFNVLYYSILTTNPKQINCHI